MGGVAEDFRSEVVRNRRFALGCAWLFVAVPGVFGIVVLIGSGFTSIIGWIMTSIFTLTTAVLLAAFVRARSMPVAAPGSGRRGRFGDLTY